jgi:hypothetical protein
MLRNFFSRLFGKPQGEPQPQKDSSEEQGVQCLDEIKASLRADFSFLISTYGFREIDERYGGRGACFVILQNELMRLRVASGGGLGGYGWSVGNKDADLVFEMGSGWLNLLRFVNSKLGANELLPETGLKSWEPIPMELLRDKYSQVLVMHMPELSRLFREHGRVDSIPDRIIAR